MRPLPTFSQRGSGRSGACFDPIPVSRRNRAGWPRCRPLSNPWARHVSRINRTARRARHPRSAGRLCHRAPPGARRVMVRASSCCRSRSGAWRTPGSCRRSFTRTKLLALRIKYLARRAAAVRLDRLHPRLRGLAGRTRTAASAPGGRSCPQSCSPSPGPTDGTGSSGAASRSSRSAAYASPPRARAVLLGERPLHLRRPCRRASSCSHRTRCTRRTCYRSARGC